MYSLVIGSAASGIVVVGEAASGEEALACVDELDPGVVLLDQMMPGLSGLETAERILQRRPDQAIVLFSAAIDDELRDRALALGIAACLAKDRLISVPQVLVSAATTGGPGDETLGGAGDDLGGPVGAPPA